MNRSDFQWLLRGAALSIWLLSIPTFASERTVDLAVVPERFVQCTTCHGVELMGNASVEAPRLNGMASWYVRSQLLAFKRGWRGTHPQDRAGLEMRFQAVALTASEIDAATTFVSSLAPSPQLTAPRVRGDITRGGALYTDTGCAACHGNHGQGNEAIQAPALAGQSDWYLETQLQNYARGARGYHAEDTLGTQMRLATSLPQGDGQAADIVAYINTLKPKEF